MMTSLSSFIYMRKMHDVETAMLFALSYPYPPQSITKCLQTIVTYVNVYWDMQAYRQSTTGQDDQIVINQKVSHPNTQARHSQNLCLKIPVWFINSPLAIQKTGSNRYIIFLEKDRQTSNSSFITCYKDDRKIWTSVARIINMCVSDHVASI